MLTTIKCYVKLQQNFSTEIFCCYLNIQQSSENLLYISKAEDD